jgi:hypothetical protein
LGISLGERAAENGEILGEDVRGAPVDETVAGDETVAVDDLRVHAEIAAMMADELIGFLKGAGVEEEIDALTRRHFAFLVLARAALFTASRFGRGVAAREFLHAI